MRKVLAILQNRNFILVLSVLLGLTIGEYSVYFKKFNLYILMTVMFVSLSGISFSSLKPLSKVLKIMSYSIFLNYFVFGALLLALAYLLIDDKEIFNGFIAIAATPAGVASIPFTFILKADGKNTIIGVLGIYLSSIILTPLIIYFFTGDSSIQPIDLVWMTVQVVVIPMVLSRFLLWKKIAPTVQKIRGRIVDFGFALIVFTIVGLNRDVFFSNPSIILICSIILVLCTFVLGLVYEKLFTRIIKPKELLISQNLVLTIKSFGFAATTSLTIFGEKASIPSAVLSIIVLLYLVFLSMRSDYKKN